MNNKAVLLARKSQVRDEQDAATIARQLEDARRYCENHTPPLEVLAELFDTESGFRERSRNARPGLREALRMVEDGEVGHLVTARLDRLTRGGSLVFLNILNRVENAGASLHILEYQIDSSKAMGKGVLALLAAVASDFSEKTSTNVKRAELASASQGKRHGGRRPFGWHQASKLNGEAPCPSCGELMRQEEVKGRLVAAVELCPVESEILREAARRITAGEPARSVVVDLNRRNLRTASGQLWAASTLTRALKSPGIIGRRTHLGVEYDGAFPGILTPEEHASVLAELGRKTLSITRTTNPPLLSGMGILFCECGAPLRSSMPSRPGQAGRYRCAGTDPNSEGCGKVSAVQPGVDTAVVKQAIRGIENWRTVKVPAGPSEFEVLTLQLQNDKESLAELTKARFVDRTLHEDSFRAAYDPLKVRIEETEALLQAAVPPPQQDEHLPSADESLEVWWEGKTPEERRAIIKYYVTRVIVSAAAGKGPKFDTGRVKVYWTWNFVAAFQ